MNIKLYDGPKVEGEDRNEFDFTIINEPNTSDTNPEAVWGLVTYEITGLEYKTEYDLYIQIGNNEETSLGLITTLDPYSWVTPVNITLFIIIIIEVITSAVLFRLLFMHTRDKASL